MAEFTPDVDALLKRFVITKPNEQFQVEPVAPDPTTTPSPLGKTDFAVPDQPQGDRLQDEAAKVQEIIQILKDTAPQIAVPVAPEEQPFLGTTITTNDYISSLENPDDLSQRKQQQFEAAVIHQSGDNPNWPVLMLGDLVQTRNSLLSARDMMVGKMLSTPLISTVTSGGLESWQASLQNSGLAAINDQVIQGSAKLRFKVAQTVFTLQGSLQGSMIENLLAGAISPEIEQIKPALRTLLGFLQQIRALLTHSQLLLAFEHLNTGASLLSLAENVVIEKILNILVVKLSDVVSSFVNPVLDALDKGLGSGPLLKLVGSSTDQQLVSMIGGTCQAIVNEYKQQVAGFLRDQEKKNNLQLSKLQSLGEHSLVGRWIVHLDQITTLLQKVLATPSLTLDAATKALTAAIQLPPASSLPILQRFLNHPELQQAQTLPLQARIFGSSPADSPAVIPIGNDGPPLPDQSPQFGSLNVNPYPNL